MSKLDDYLWFEMNMYDIQKQNKNDANYVIILDQKVLGFEDSYQEALRNFGGDCGIFYIQS